MNNNYAADVLLEQSKRLLSVLNPSTAQLNKFKQQPEQCVELAQLLSEVAQKAAALVPQISAKRDTD